MIPVSVPGIHAASLTSLMFRPESLNSPDCKSRRPQLDSPAVSLKLYCETDNRATEPSPLGLSAPRRGALSSFLCDSKCQLHYKVQGSTYSGVNCARPVAANADAIPR